MSYSTSSTGYSVPVKTESEEEEELLEKKSDEDTDSDPVSDGDLLLEEDVAPRIGLEENVAPRIGLEEDVAPRIGLEDHVAPRIGLEEDVTPRTGLEEDEDVTPRTGLEEDVALRTGLDENVVPRIGLEDHVAPRNGLEDDVGPRNGLEDNVVPRIGLEVDIAPRIGFEDDVVPRIGLEDDVPPRIVLEDDVAPRIGLEDNVAPRIGLQDDVVPRICPNLIFDEMTDDKTQQSGFCSRTKKRKKKYHLNQTTRCLDELPNDEKGLKSSSFRTNKRKKTQHIDKTIRCNERSVNLILVGKAGSGKSTTGNMILEKELFHVSSQAQLVTRQCQLENVNRDNVNINIVDTPGLFSLEMESSTVQAKIRKFLKDHLNIFPLIFVLCIPAGVRFTKEDKAIINHIEENFGTCVLQNLMVVFTGTLPMISDVKNNPKWFKRFLDNIENRTFHFKPDSSDREIQESLFIKACQMLLKKKEHQNYSFYDYKTAQRLI